MPVLGAVSVMVAMLTLCGGGIRFVKPEGALGVETLAPVFEVAIARQLFFGSLAVWMILAIVLAVAGAGLAMGRRWGRALGLVYAWGALASVAVMTFLNLVVVLPALDESGLAWMETAWTMAAGPITGCCPTIFAVVVLGILYHDRVSAWAGRG